MGVSDIEGKAPKAFGASEWSRWAASDIDGQTERSNVRAHMSQCGQPSEFQTRNP
jgi:hypothetical protein